MEKIARRYYVSGLVQGVGFRYFAQRAGAALKLDGWVRNLRDGRVEAYAIGRKVQLDAFESKLNQGPASGYVSEIVVEQAAVDATIEGFCIR